MPLVIDSSNAEKFLQHVQDKGYARGLARRDFEAMPPGSQPSVPVYPDSLLLSDDDIKTRLKQQQQDKASLYDLRVMFYDQLKSLNQNPYKLCWAFSSTKAAMYARVLGGLPPLVLSAWYVAGKVNGWRNQGGRGIDSSSFIAENGAPLMSMCPKFSSNYDTPDTEENAKLHKISHWYEGTQDRNRNMRILLSALALGGAGVGDYMWLGHSMEVCRALDLTTLDADNSWGEIDEFGENGLYRLRGSHAVPDNVVVVFSSAPSVN